MGRQVATDDKKAGAEVYKGSESCRKKTMELLEQVGLPNGLILLDDIQECGHVRETGFVWMKRNKKFEHEFKAIERLVQYDTEISGYVEQHKMKEVSGVKIKELLVWITISEISIDDPASAQICFKSAGNKKSFPVGAFEIQIKTDAEIKTGVEIKTDASSKKHIPEINKAAIKTDASSKKHIPEINKGAMAKIKKSFPVGPEIKKEGAEIKKGAEINKGAMAKIKKSFPVGPAIKKGAEINKGAEIKKEGAEIKKGAEIKESDRVITAIKQS